MAKRKDLLLKESTVSRMMGLAGIGALTNPFLRESYGEEQEMEEGYDTEQELDEMYEEEGMEDPESDMDDMGDEDDMDDMGDEDDMDDMDDMGDEDEEESDMPHDIRDFGDLDRDDYLEEAEEPCKKCGKLHEGSCGGGYMQESIHKSMKRLKRLLEQAEGDVPPPAPEGDVPPPESAPGGGDEMESKIKEFVKKLGELVQETLGVEVTVEEGEGEPEMPEGEAGAPPPPAGGAGAPPPAPLQEAINRLVNKVARRVKARLMEAKGEKEKAIETKRKMSAKRKEQMKMKALKEKQAASKKKEMEAAKKKKEMEMKKKKAAMAKKK